MYRVKLTSTKGGIKPLLINLDDQSLEKASSLKKQGLVKIKVLETNFKTSSGKIGGSTRTKLNAWLKSVEDLSNGKLTLDNQNFKKGTFFRFKGEKTVRVYEGRHGIEHDHYKFEDTNDHATTRGHREIESDFTF